MTHDLNLAKLANIILTIDQQQELQMLTSLLCMAKSKVIPAAIRPYVFGSWMNGTPHRWSDIDICVVSPAFRNWKTKVERLAKARTEDFLTIEPHGVHPKDFRPNSNTLVHEVMAHGVKVK